MSLTGITIEGFKGIRGPVSIPIRPLTLLFGANSAGKSTVLHALHVAREVILRGNVDPGVTELTGDLDLGGFRNLVHGRDLSRPIRLGFELNLENVDMPAYGDLRAFGWSQPRGDTGEWPCGWSTPTRVQVKLTLRWSELSRRPFVAEYSVCFDDAEIARIEAGSDGRNVALTVLDMGWWSDDGPFQMFHVDVDLGPWTQGEPTGEGGRLRHLHLPLSQRSALPERAKRLPLGVAVEDRAQQEQWEMFALLISEWIVGPLDVLRAELEGLTAVGPLRKVPPRGFRPLRHPDPRRWYDGLGAWDELHRFEEPGLPALFLSSASLQYLTRTEATNTGGYELARRRVIDLDAEGPLMALAGDLDRDPAALPRLLGALPQHARVVLVDKAKGMDFAPEDVGVGISQVVPVVVAACHGGALVCIEQPELHVNPSVQVALGDVFISQFTDVEYAPRRALIETHSEALLLRLRRRIRETTEGTLPTGAQFAVRPSDIAILIVEPGIDGTTIRELRLSDQGDLLDPWPDGFFDESYRELFGE